MQVRNGDRLFYVEHVSNPERLAERLANAASWLPASAWSYRQIKAYVAPKYAISYFAQPQKLDGPRVLSLLPSGRGLCCAKDAVSEQWLPTPHYVSDLTTEEARSLAKLSTMQGSNRKKRGRTSCFTCSSPQARASIDPSPRKGTSETWSSFTSSPPSRTASTSARSAGERLRIDRLQAHDTARVESASATNPRLRQQTPRGVRMHRLVIAPTPGARTWKVSLRFRSPLRARGFTLASAVHRRARAPTHRGRARRISTCRAASRPA